VPVPSAEQNQVQSRLNFIGRDWDGPLQKMRFVIPFVERLLKICSHSPQQTFNLLKPGSIKRLGDAHRT
jgi:hypothetical protein